MSIQVPTDGLPETLRAFGGAYLATVGEQRRAHIVSVAPVLRDGRLHLGEPGRTTGRNVAENPVVTLVWPPLEPGGYSLIADGTGSLGAGGELVVEPTRAVLHRPAATPADAGTDAGSGGCVADCAEVAL
jgi:hypothetical protein